MDCYAINARYVTYARYARYARYTTYARYAADAQDADGDEGTNVDIDVDSGKACKTGRKEAFDLVGDVSGDEDSTDVSSRSEFDEESERDIRGLVGV